MPLDGDVASSSCEVRISAWRACGVTRGANSRLTPPASGERPALSDGHDPRWTAAKPSHGPAGAAEPCEAWGVPHSDPGRPTSANRTANNGTGSDAFLRKPPTNENPKESHKRTTQRTPQRPDLLPVSHASEQIQGNAPLRNDATLPADQYQSAASRYRPALSFSHLGSS